MTTQWLARKSPNTYRPDVVELKAPIAPPRTRSANAYRPDVVELKVERSKPPVERRPDMIRKARVLALKRFLAFAVLVPLSLFVLLAFKDLFFHSEVKDHLWGSASFQWFIGGALLWLAVFGMFRHFFSIVYVFGHEWTHIFAARLCRGVVYDYHIGWDGGWVDTNKSNTFISLSPYLIPFYTTFAVLGFAAVGVFLNLDAPMPIGSVGWLQSFTLMKGLYFAIGLTWSFHLSYTLRTLRHRQTDVLRNGVWFSRFLIFIVNLAIVGLFLVAASPTISVASAAASVGQTGQSIVTTYWGGIRAASHAVSAEAAAMKQDLDAWKVKAQVR